MANFPKVNLLKSQLAKTVGGKTVLVLSATFSGDISNKGQASVLTDKCIVLLTVNSPELGKPKFAEKCLSWTHLCS